MATAPASTPTPSTPESNTESTPGSSPVDHRVVIIGSGFAGVCMAIQLKLRGIDDFVVLEKDDDLGGTWRDNTYPGCACDVPSYLYSFSFEQNPRWTRMFAPQQEIWDYIRHCVNKYGIGAHFHYNATVTGAEFDEATGTWQVWVNDNEMVTSRSLVTGVGALHHPKTPDLPGLDTFEGTTFHSAHWNHEHDLRGRNVAVVGTGASAIQFVPQIAEDVAHLDVYQRSAPWITPKPDRAIGVRERDVHSRFPAGQRFIRNLLYWAMELRGVGFAVNPKMMKAIELQARHHLKKQVPDPELRRKLTPDYAVGCKRVLLSNDYYPALRRDNVDLVTDGIARLTPTGVVTEDGVEREVDVVVVATGFHTTDLPIAERLAGRGGVTLAERFEQHGMQAYKGTTVHGFPNLFFVVGPNTGLGHSSMVFMIESQVAYIVDAVTHLKTHGFTSAEPRAEVQRAHNEALQRRMRRTVWSAGGCASWYLDSHGRNVTLWPRATFTFRRELAQFDIDAYALRTAPDREEVST
jgi:cation diffusion facilitator CzcD-associated flavoprotein CzcO